MTWSSEGVVIRGGDVVASGRSTIRDVKIQGNRFVSKLPKVSTVVNADGLFVTPGLIDLQINGFGGCEFIEGDAAVARAQEQLPRYGVTSFLPTIGTQPLEKYRPSALRRVFEQAKVRGGAEVLGWHLEGPFLNPHQCGIHRCSYLLDHFDEPFWSELFRTKSIALMTLAPEMPFAARLLDMLASFEVSAAIGHSMAEEADLLMAHKKGVRFVTHLFNAMLPFHHRSPGIIGAVLGEALLGFTVVSDLYHVYPEALQMAFKCNPNGLAIVTDGNPLLGGTEKKGTFLGNLVEVQGEKVITIPGGGLAGSIIPLDEQLRRLMLVTGCPFETVVRAVTEVPASFVHQAKKKGKIAVGNDADCVLWQIMNTGMRVLATFCRGELAFSHDDFWPRVTKV